MDFSQISFIDVAAIAAASFVGGYVVLLALVFILLPRKLRSENNVQRAVLLSEAKVKAETIQEEEFDRTTDSIQFSRDELESEIADRKIDLETLEEDLNHRQEYIKNEEARIQRLQREFDSARGKSQHWRSIYASKQEEISAARHSLQVALATATGNSVDEIRKSLRDDYIEQRQLECTKRMKILADELNTNANRLASRLLARTHSRYSPEFVWPKGMNHVELKNPSILDTLENHPLLSDLTELTEGVTITAVPPAHSGQSAIVRLGGGFGIYKEAAKLTLEELVNRNPNQWDKVQSVYVKHREALEAHALKLGKQALIDLQLDGIHIEILKMVGSLNWRTSYRQNQYYHSVEVAKLAGIIATELGVDPDAAKRCGLLHDIGKSIDYRIEGSHAVISGDYADRYGERKEICDTVMSHHADLIMETPLAFVLMSADTLSGARPGARVNLEEGYQDRLSSIQDVVRTFPGVVKVEIMNGAREVHVEVNHKKVGEKDLENLSAAIARKIEEDVAYPGQIKILVARRFEAVAVA